MARTPQDVVSLYLRGQNLEQMHRFDDAAALYEQAVQAGFDAAGPYDRLIAIYQGSDRHADVIRVADAALAHVRTFSDKRRWYESIREGSVEALERRSDRRGAEF